MSDIHLSLSALLKQSAMQSCYLRKKKKEKPVSEAMVQGNILAHEKSISEYVEMRGTYNHKSFNNFLIHYAFDEIEVNDKSALLIEHKNITSEKPVEMWYFESCVLQTAVYQAFAKVNKNKHLQTATFHIKEGNPKEELELNNLYLRSQLRMGDDVYTVVVTDPIKLVNFYCRKAEAILDYDNARKFDSLYKFKEYKALKECLSFRPITLESKVA